jgi:hypothetical protein
MEEPIKTIETKHRNAMPLIVTLLVVIFGLVGIILWCLFYKDHPSSSATPSDSTETSTTGGASGPCAGGAENTAPAGFTFYESAEYGFKFAYPSTWGSVTIATTPMGGVGGHYLQGHFTANDDVWFGGNATDYIVQGRDGIATDNPGYLQAGDRFYTVQIWTYRAGPPPPDEPLDDLHPITEDATLKDGCNTKALVSQYPAGELIDYSYDVARFNLRPTNIYYGVNFVLKNPDASKRADLDKLIGTFQLLP